MSNLSISGFDETIRALRGLPVKIRRQLVKNVIRPETASLKRLCKDETPVLTGALKRSVGTQQQDFSRASSQSGEIISSVGIRKYYVDPKTGKKPILYAKKIYYNSKSGYHFLANGFDAWVSGAESRIKSKFSELIRDINNKKD